MDATDPTQHHLTLPGMSGRGVRLRLLEPAEHREAEESGAKLAGEKATGLELRNSQLHQGICRMVCEYTEPVRGARKGEDGKEVPRTLRDPDVKWMRVGFSELSMPDGPRSLGRLFTAKDIAYFERVYIAYHEVNSFELNELMGKALPVASGD